MKHSTIKKYIQFLNEVKNSGKTLFDYCNKKYWENTKGIAYGYKGFINNIALLKKKEFESNEEIQELLKLYSEVTSKERRRELREETIEQIDTDDRAETSIIRDEDGKIQYYSYQIFRRNKAPLTGKLTREEMNTIYRLYSYYGDSLTQRVIARHFVDLSLVDFKRILRAFNITKASAPFAPHYFEEMSEEELREIQLREKENSFLRKAEEDQIKNTEKLLKKYAQENIDLRTQIDNKKDLLAYLESKNIDFNKEIITKSTSTDTDIVVVLSDLHVGAFNEKFGFLPLEVYDEKEITRRLNKIIESLHDSYSSITILNLGDSVDSYNKQTTRGGHDLPGSISNKEQSLLYQKIMLEFFAKLVNYSNNINYICVGESNHDGDWGWINNIVLSSKLKENFNINSFVSNNPIDIFNIQDCSLIYLHGKDNYNQFKNFPLVINNKTETWFNNYFLDCGKKLCTNKYVIKGDLHQYAYTCAKHFDYISAPSIYGSSNWIAANFGKTPWGALILEVNNNNMTTKLIRE